MTSPDDASKPQEPPADHAGSVLCRLLIAHPEVVDIEILGQLDLPDLFAFQIDYIYDRHNFVSFSSACDVRTLCFQPAPARSLQNSATWPSSLLSWPCG